MATGITVRELDGTTTELVLDGHHFRRPDELTPTDELDTASLWAMPGLADCHTHLSGSSVDEQAGPDDIDQVVADHAWAHLEAGVFLVADKGTHDEASLRILETPPERRPDLHMAGRIITCAGGYYEGFGHEVDADDLLTQVAESATSAATWIKLIGDWPKKGIGPTPNWAEEAFHEAAAIAHRAGRRVAIHAAAPETSSIAVRAGIDSIEHGLFLTPDDLVMLGERDGAWVPTIYAMEAIGEMLGPDSSGGRMFAEGLGNVREILAEAPDAGVAVLAGTDLGAPHGGVALEALRLAEYGLSADQVLHAMTTAAYDYLGTEQGFASGQAADVVFFDSDPRENLEALTDPAIVIRHGHVLRNRLEG